MFEYMKVSTAFGQTNDQCGIESNDSYVGAVRAGLTQAQRSPALSVCTTRDEGKRKLEVVSTSSIDSTGWSK